MPASKSNRADTAEEPLNDEEIRKLRAIVEADERVQWFWGTVRTWAVWVSAVVLGVTVGWDALGKIIRSLGKG